MAFSDWVTVYNTSGTSTLSSEHELITQILGTGSLRQGVPNTTTSDTLGIFTHLDSPQPQGLIKGGMQSILRWDNTQINNASLTDTGVFFCFMCDDFDPTLNAALYYLAGLTVGGDGDATKVTPIILRSNNTNFLNFGDLDVGSVRAIADTADPITFAPGDQIAMQVSWDYSESKWGGTHLTLSVGTVGDTDFTTLTTVYNFVDGSGLVTTSVIEGLAFLKLDTAPSYASGDEVVWDSTSLLAVT